MCVGVWVSGCRCIYVCGCGCMCAIATDNNNYCLKVCINYMCVWGWIHIIIIKCVIIQLHYNAFYLCAI